MYDLTYRPRRLRINPEMRDLVRETTLDVTDLIYPLFIVPGEGIKKEIDTLPGQYHLSVDEAVKVAQPIAATLELPKARVSLPSLYRASKK